MQVGGPSTAVTAWIAAFLAHTHSAGVPVDFVSTHVYANDSPRGVFGTGATIAREQMVWRAVQKVHEEIQHSAYPHLPLIFSEYNASFSNEPDVTDTDYMGPWLANTVRLCDGLTESLDYWTFSDVFEEQGVVRTPFYGGFGLIAADHIDKPVLNAFRLLHKLGDRRIAVDSDAALATTSPGHGLAVALWNYAPTDGNRTQLYRAPRASEDLRGSFICTFSMHRPRMSRSGGSTTTTAMCSRPSMRWAVRPAT